MATHPMNTKKVMGSALSLSRYSDLEQYIKAGLGVNVGLRDGRQEVWDQRLDLRVADHTSDLKAK